MEKEEEEKEREEKEELSTTDSKQVARHELLQHMQGLSSVLQSAWWRTDEGIEVQRRLEETYRRLANGMTEEYGSFPADSQSDAIAQVPPSSSSREESAEGEAAAGEVSTLEEVTGKDAKRLFMLLFFAWLT